ncbi:MBL fold metallo-hydrolase [Nocardioides sp. CBS4Y-1]|uniref:MBL fold metallo-hydrolase n=2 Tax=Nocardioides acrostichi TaxID=2784339 RepID=A0A930UWF1_9ACTN|nr:MBL fold metallo-hydrolase [Nocardioides acrostichi]
MDGLRAINVYVIEDDDGLTLIDGGWAIPVARDLLDRSLTQLGAGFGDIRRFLVTHVHRDHFTMATVLGHELGVDVGLGVGEKPALDLLNNLDRVTESPFLGVLRSAGAHEVADLWAQGEPDVPPREHWAYPTHWFESDHAISVGERIVDAVHTPGHTPGHFVFADRAAGLLFAGDHVLPTITPSIGFTMPPVDNPLGQFMASLTKVRSLPDLRVLPAHGPVAESTHARCDELLAHHDTRLAASLAALDDGPRTALEVAGSLGWTRHEKAFADLDPYNQGMAAMETKAHLDLLVARGDATATDDEGGVVYAPVVEQR